MSHTVHPYSHRLGIIRDWKSRWFSSHKGYRSALKGDLVIREFLTEALRSNYVGGVEIERNQKALRIIIKTSRPGLLIGKAGDGVTKLRAKIMRLLHDRSIALNGQELKIDIEEVRNPESNAAIAGMMVAESLEKRLPFRRVMKQTIEKVMANKEVKGIRIRLAGRLGGAEIARTEELKKGQIPLQTLRADIDFAREKAHMTYGDIGIKVWIYKGEIFKKDQKNT
ncbi:MAG: 30S ribosomal protein S3 [Patescibacteria group bacterium]|nr:30S ribosomal protein S3 [Patescibacteria group bacterium]MDE1941309.1 30S ribosomal protein S3 [Patescibacteria group bacterium]MDE1966510.1 30S ribosomal protein S3 [Patescibacteria group bacterium]